MLFAKTQYLYYLQASIMTAINVKNSMIETKEKTLGEKTKQKKTAK